MSQFAAFVGLGFGHITTFDALDHILFLLALAAVYSVRDWKDTLWVITAFTVGHSVTLVIAVAGLLRLPTDLVEFLIPVTIVATCVENFFVRERKLAGRNRYRRPILAGVFGLVHGAGFANYLQNVFPDRMALPLFGFNVGIELGQIAVLATVFAGLYSVDRLVSWSRVVPANWTVIRLRAAAVSFVVMVVAARWAVMRAPW
ncbi:MAG: HupE/UreJ family protein [Gemmatimonadaceae bacterium]|nr:HupE/UreJ family protein [Gemmatimonadaceae bacterium]